MMSAIAKTILTWPGRLATPGGMRLAVLAQDDGPHRRVAGRGVRGRHQAAIRASRNWAARVGENAADVTSRGAADRATRGDASRQGEHGRRRRLVSPVRQGDVAVIGV